MSQAITKIKSRIKTVTSAYKVTSAMKLVSSVKLATWRSKMLALRDYTSQIENATNDVFMYLDNVSNPLCNENKKVDKDLYIIISSSLGLCGAYNTNIFKLADVTVKENDEAIILGKKGAVHFSNGKFKCLEGFDNYSSIKDMGVIKSLTSFIINSFNKEKYHEVHFIYTKYKNPITFISKDKKLLPLINNKTNEPVVGVPPLMEPSKDKLIEKLVPFYIQNQIYAFLLESEVCEQASRSNAMENATKNAEELLNNLQIEFNKARQGAITQEIIEIVAASESL